MQRNISKWYQSCEIRELSQEQYLQRLEGIKEFGESKPGISICNELVKGFMGVEYNKENIADFINVFNEKDVSFSEASIREIPLLAGMFLLYYVKNNREDIAVMLLLLYRRGYIPYQKEIYEQIMAIYENKCMEIRQESEVEDVKIASYKKISDEEKEDWSVGADYLQARLTEQLRYIRGINANFGALRKQLEYKREESNLLWWMVAEWSDIYDCSFKNIDDKLLALVIPFEVMSCVSQVPGPIAVKKIIKKALSGREINKTYAVKDYISVADEKILSYCKDKNYDLSKYTGFVLVLELLQKREEFLEQEELSTVYSIFEKKYDSAFLNQEITVGEFACQLYYECELMELVG